MRHLVKQRGVELFGPIVGTFRRNGDPVDLLARRFGASVEALDDFDDRALAALVGADGMDLVPTMAIALRGSASVPTGSNA